MDGSRGVVWGCSPISSHHKQWRKIMNILIQMRMINKCKLLFNIFCISNFNPTPQKTLDPPMRVANKDTISMQHTKTMIGSSSSSESTIIGRPFSFLSSYMSLMSMILFSNLSIHHTWLPFPLRFTKMAGSETNAPFC